MATTDALLVNYFNIHYQTSQLPMLNDVLNQVIHYLNINSFQTLYLDVIISKAKSTCFPKISLCVLPSINTPQNTLSLTCLG